MNSSPWRLEEVDGGGEQYPVESRFVVRHTPPDEQDPRFDRSAPTQVRFVRFAVRHTPPDQQDPVSTVGGPTQVCFLRFSVRKTPPCFERGWSNTRLFPPFYGTPGLVSIGCSVQASWLPMNTMTHSVPTQSVASP